MAVKQLDKSEWTKDGRKWIFYDYVKNLDGTRRKYKSKKFFTKPEALKAEREFLTTNTERADKDRNMTFKDLYTLFYAYKEDKVKFTTLKTYRDRQKFFKNLENVKKSYLNYAKLLPEHGHLILNIDDPNTHYLKDLKNTLTYSIKDNNAYINARNITFSNKGFPTFDVYINNLFLLMY